MEVVEETVAPAAPVDEEVLGAWPPVGVLREAPGAMGMAATAGPAVEAEMETL